METVTMKWSRRPFISLGIIFLIIGVMPYWQHVTTSGLPDGKSETKNVFTLGIPPSPLFLLEQSHSEQVRGTGTTATHGWSSRLEFISLSTLALVLGAALLVANRFFGRQPEPISGKQPSAPSPSDGGT
jgi:hypothetical protein